MTTAPSPGSSPKSGLKLTATLTRPSAAQQTLSSACTPIVLCAMGVHAAPPGGASGSILAAELAGAAAPDKRWAFNDTACARLNDSGGKVSVLFWLESLESALCGKLGINDTKIQGQHLRLLLEGPILESESLINSSAELRNSLTCELRRRRVRRPLLTTLRRSSPAQAPGPTIPWPSTARQVAAGNSTGAQTSS